MVTVGDILNLPVFQGSIVRAGQQGLDTPVSGGTVMEVPDIAPWVRPGDIVFTTLFAVHRKSQALRDLVPALQTAGCAALAIKTKRYVEEIPDALLRTAERLHFPVIELTADVTHSLALESVQFRLMADRVSDVERMTLQVAESAEPGRHRMAALLRTLAQELEGSALALMTQGRSLVTMGPGADNVTQHYAYLSDVVWTPLYLTGHSAMATCHVTTLSIETTYLRVFRFDVPYPDPLTLLVWERGDPLNDRQLALCARVLSLVMMEWVREQTRSATEKRYRQSFLRCLLTGELSSPDEVAEQAREVGWNLPEGLWCVVVLDPASKPGASVRPPVTRSLVGGDLAEALKSAGLGVIAGHLGRRSILLWHDPPPPAKAEGMLETMLGEVAPRQPFHVGIGRTFSLAHIAESYRDARATVDYLLQSQTLTVYHYSRLGLNGLLTNVPRSNLSAFVEEWLGPLTHYDALHHTTLADTLQSYFVHGGNIPKTARSLFVHYNTVMNRLHQIEAVMGRSMRDPNVALNLQVALRASLLLTTAKPEAEAATDPNRMVEESGPQ